MPNSHQEKQCQKIAKNLVREGFGLDSIENPQGGVTAAPSFFASLGLPVPPSRKSFALSCRVSASSRHISALF